MPKSFIITLEKSPRVVPGDPSLFKDSDFPITIKGDGIITEADGENLQNGVFITIYLQDVVNEFKKYFGVDEIDIHADYSDTNGHHLDVSITEHENDDDDEE